MAAYPHFRTTMDRTFADALGRVWTGTVWLGPVTAPSYLPHPWVPAQPGAPAPTSSTAQTATATAAPPPAASRPQPLTPEQAAKLVLDLFAASTPPEHVTVEVLSPPGVVFTSDALATQVRHAARTHTPAMDVTGLSVELAWPGGGGTPSRFVVSGIRRRGG